MRNTTVLTILACLSFTVNVAIAETWPQMQKFLASDGAANDNFGFSVAISGNYAIVGARMDDDMGTDSGSAYIFYWDGTSWTQQAKLTASDGAAFDYFGKSVSISGASAIVGAYANDDNGDISGSAYIFTRIGTTWAQQTKLLASDGATHDWFGESVAIDGDYAIVGAIGESTHGAVSGAAYIFVRGFTGWKQQAKLLASDGAAGDNFGNSVSISGDYAIVGAYRDDDLGNYSGSAYVFKRNDTTWAQMQKFLAPDGAYDDWFGNSVSISGDYAIVGAPNDDDLGESSGSAYLFKRSGKTWSLQQKLTPSDGDAGAGFGVSVALRGDCAAVGAEGSVYIFKTSGATWTQQAKLTPSDNVDDDEFAYSVALSGDFVLAGAYHDDDNGDVSGSAYLFGFTPDADLNDDFKVDLADFAEFARWWLFETGQ
ncbi:MAG: FG-GAP repeat protein [Anaerohalosphaeraceae bacterium]